MTSQHVYTLTQATNERTGHLTYAVLYNGQPLMASTPDKSRAVALLSQQLALADRRNLRPVVQDWDGDTGTLRVRPLAGITVRA